MSTPLTNKDNKPKPKTHHRIDNPSDLILKGKSLELNKRDKPTSKQCHNYKEDWNFNNPTVHGYAKRDAEEMLMLKRNFGEIVDYLTDYYHLYIKDAKAIIQEAMDSMNKLATMEQNETRMLMLAFAWQIAKSWMYVDGKTSLAALNVIAKLNNLYDDRPLVENNTVNIDLKNADVSDINLLIEQIQNTPTNADQGRGHTNLSKEEDLKKLEEIEQYLRINNKNLKLDDDSDERTIYSGQEFEKRLKNKIDDFKK